MKADGRRAPTALPNTAEQAAVKAHRFRSLLIGLVNDLAHVRHAGRNRFSACFGVRAFLLSRQAVPSFKQGPQ
jgi:hypothetical protein